MYNRLENRAQILSTMDNELEEGDNENNNTDFFIQQTVRIIPSIYLSIYLQMTMI